MNPDSGCSKSLKYCSLTLYLQNNQTHQVIPIQYDHIPSIKKGE